MKRYRLCYFNINSGKEFFVDVDSNDEILPALQKKPEYVRDPNNWECFDTFANKTGAQLQECLERDRRYKGENL